MQNASDNNLQTTYTYSKRLKVTFAIFTLGHMPISLDSYMYTNISNVSLIQSLFKKIDIISLKQYCFILNRQGSDIFSLWVNKRTEIASK